MNSDHLDDFPPAIKERSAERLLQLCGGERAVISVSVRVLLRLIGCLGPGNRNRFIEQLEAIVEIQGTGQPVHVYRPFTTRDGSKACRYCCGRSDSPAHVPEPEAVSIGGVWYPRPERGRMSLTVGVANDHKKTVTITYHSTGNVVYRQDGAIAEVYEAIAYNEGTVDKPYLVPPSDVDPEYFDEAEPESFEDKVARADALGTRLFCDGTDEGRVQAFTMLRDKFQSYLDTLERPERDNG